MEKEAEQFLEIKGEENESLLNIPTDNNLIEVTEVPSGFKGYPKGTKIYYKPIDLDEMETLNSGNPDINRNIAYILNAIKCNTLDSADLYYWDVIYIGVKRLLTALGGTTGTLPGVCPKCRTIVYKKFNYTDINFKTLDIPDLPMKMEIGGKQIEFGLTTMKEFLSLPSDGGEMAVYATYIKNLKESEKLPFVKGLMGIDIKKIRFVDKQLDYGITPFKVKCTQKGCGQEVPVEVTPFGVLFPEDELGDDNEFEVQYG